jgi:hypothetical protein
MNGTHLNNPPIILGMYHIWYVPMLLYNPMLYVMYSPYTYTIPYTVHDSGDTE